MIQKEATNFEVARTRETWLRDRERGIGASDSPIVLGVSTYKSAFQLWCEKTGHSDPEDLSGLERIKWGNRLQDRILEGFAEDEGRLCTAHHPFKIVQDSQYPWLIGTPDGFQTSRDRDGTGVVEIKNVDSGMDKEWKDEPPLAFQVQLQHAMRITGLGWGSLVALVGGNRLVYFDFERDDRFIHEALLPRLKDFWDCVQEKRPPAVDGSFATAKLLSRLHPDDDGRTVMLDDEAVSWLAELEVAKAQIKAAEAAKTLAENRLKAAIGSATFAQAPDGTWLSYKTQERDEHIAKASKFRVLRPGIKPPK